MNKKLILLLVLTFLAHLPLLWGKRLHDDMMYIYDNPFVQSFRNADYILRNFYHNRGWVQYSFAYEFWLHGGKSVYLHLTSVCLHVINTGLVYLCAARLFRSLRGEENEKNTYAALAVALFFGIHPINTEPIAHLISRADLIATFFFMLGYYVLLKMIEWRPSGRQFFYTLLLLVICSFFSLLGLGGKEIIVTLPVMMVITFLLYHRRESNGYLLSHFIVFLIPVFLVFVAYFTLRYMSYGSILGFDDTSVRSYSTNLYSQLVIIVFYYLPRFFVPVNLYYDPFYPEYTSLFNAYVLSSITIITALILWAVYAFRRYPLLTLGILWFFITVSPTSSFLPLSDLIAERRVYLSSFGIFLIWVDLFLRAWERANAPMRKKWETAALGFFAILTLMAFVRSVEFQNGTALFAKDLMQQMQYKAPKERTINQVITQSVQNGHAEFGYKILNRAKIDLVQTAVKTRNIDFLNDILRFLSLLKINDPRLAGYTERFLKHDPKDMVTSVTVQNYYLQQGLYEKAEEVIRQALKYNPNHLESMLNLANIFKTQNDWESALEYIQKGMQIYPNSELPLMHMIQYCQVHGLDPGPYEQRLNEVRSQEKAETRMIETLPTKR